VPSQWESQKFDLLLLLTHFSTDLYETQNQDFAGKMWLMCDDK